MDFYSIKGLEKDMQHATFVESVSKLQPFAQSDINRWNCVLQMQSLDIRSVEF